MGGASVFGKSDSRQESSVFKDQSFYDSLFIFFIIILACFMSPREGSSY